MNFVKIRLFMQKINFIVGSEKKTIFFLLPLNLISSITDLLGIGLLVILITALQDTSQIIQFSKNIPIINNYAHLDNIHYLILLFSLAIFFVYLTKTILTLLTNYLTLNITFSFGAKIRSFLMRIYQSQNYKNFVKKNTSDYIYNIQTLVGQFLSYALLPIIKIVEDSIIAFCIMIYLFIQNPYVLSGLLILSFIIGILFDLIFKKRMSSLGKQTNIVSTNMIKSINEGLNGYKESHIFGILNYFHQNLKNNAIKLANFRIKSLFIASVPRVLLEIFVVTSILLFISITVLLDNSRNELLSTLVLFVLASARFLPAVNQIISNVSRLRFGQDALEILYKEIKQNYKISRINYEEKNSIISNSKVAKLTEFRSLEFKKVYFRFNVKSKWIINSLNFKIHNGDIIGFIGPSGEGKSTLLDLMLGFLRPNSGEIKYNNINIKDKNILKKWHSNISYLPQEIFLVDDTLEANIALGSSKDNIDKSRVLDSLKKAKLDDLIRELPNGLVSYIGENGNLLSGGQRQRIAIARAFYFNSKFLIMDESTNALDNKTINNIKAELNNLRGKITIILITHQSSLLEVCNKIYKLEKGKLKKYKYNE